MALLKRKADQEHNGDGERFRVFPVTAKLTKEERKAVTDFAQSQGLARGQWIRDVLLAELRSARSNDVALAETSWCPFAPGQCASPTGRRPETRT